MSIVQAKGGWLDGFPDSQQLRLVRNGDPAYASDIAAMERAVEHLIFRHRSRLQTIMGDPNDVRDLTVLVGGGYIPFPVYFPVCFCYLGWHEIRGRLRVRYYVDTVGISFNISVVTLGGTQTKYVASNAGVDVGYENAAEVAFDILLQPSKDGSDRGLIGVLSFELNGDSYGDQVQMVLLSIDLFVYPEESTV